MRNTQNICLHAAEYAFIRCKWCGLIYWWLVRVTLVVNWLFLPQNFGPVVGTYEGLLRLCECTLGSGSIFRWWGHLTTIGGNRSFFLPQVVGSLKPSIILFHLSRPCLAPCLAPCLSRPCLTPCLSHPCLAPVSLPVSPLVCLTTVSPLSCSLSRPLSRSLSHSLSHRCQVVGTLKPSIICLTQCLTGVRWWGP